MKKFKEKRNLTIKIDKDIEELYRIGRQNGWDVSEIARQLLTDGFLKLANDLKRVAS